MSETPYVETEILIAVMSEDEGRARQLLADMLSGELASLESNAARVAELARDARREIRMEGQS